MTKEQEAQLRLYAESELAWRTMRNDLGWDYYGDVLAGLGELGLRPPVVNIEKSPNSEALKRGSAILRELLQRNSENK